jgi:hypothetical protein
LSRTKIIVSESGMAVADASAPLSRKNRRIPKGLTMKDAAKWGLMKAGRPLRVRELYDLLVGAGFRYEKDYESFRGSMTPTLDRDRDAFEKVGPGLYYLAEPEKQKAPHTIQGQGLLANL